MYMRTVERKVSQISLDPHIAAGYGKLDWRDEQSVIDLLQNSLDANLVRSIQTGEKFQLPQIHLRVSNGKEVRNVAMESLTQLDESWKIKGVRIADKGRGFSQELLGLMGTTTKRDAETLRGGLGEGLKMSVNRCLRAGVQMRLWSVHDSGAWIVHPQHHQDKLVFNGRLVEFERRSKITGSFTDIDLSTATDQDFAEKIADCFDPRKGEGLGKYALEFSKAKDDLELTKNSELTKSGIPAGRIYVLGLLVEERENQLLFSYNLGDKFAIGGRDRKHVDASKLEQAIGEFIQTTDSPQLIRKILQAVKDNHQTPEVLALSTTVLPNNEKTREIWRTQFEKLFNFIPGQSLITASSIETDQKRALADREYELIEVASNLENFERFIAALYPGQNVTARSALDLGQESEVSVPISQEVISQLLEDSNWVAGAPSVYAGNYWEIEASNKVPIDSPIYDSKLGKILVHPEARVDQSYKTKFWQEILKASSRVSSHSVSTQDLVDRHFKLIGGAETDSLADVLKQHPIKVLPVSVDFQGSIDAYREFNARNEILRELKSSNLSKNEVEQKLAGLLPNQSGLSSLFFVFDGVAYKIDAAHGLPKLVPMTQLDLYSKDLTRLKDFLTGTLSNISGKSVRAHQYFNKILPSHQIIETPTNFNDLTSINLSKIIEKIGDQNNSAVKAEKNEADVIELVRPIKLSALPEVVQATRPIIFNLDIPEGESRKFNFKTSSKDVTLILHNIKGRTYIEVPQPGKPSNFFDAVGTTFNNPAFNLEVGVSGIVVRSSEDAEITLLPSLSSAMLPEQNRGRPSIETSIDTNYGKGFWDHPARVFFDTLSNHIDASKSLPEIKLYIVNWLQVPLRIQEINLASLAEIPRDKLDTIMLVGFSIEDDGEGFTTPYLQILGGSSKSSSEIGKFGEGLKMVSAASKRLGLEMQIESRDWIARPTSIKKAIKDFEENSNLETELLGFNLKWNSEPRVGSKTIVSGLPIESILNLELTPADSNKLLEQFLSRDKAAWSNWSREILKLVTSESSMHLNRSESLALTPAVAFVPSSKGIYEHGMLVRTVEGENTIGGYNFDLSITSTRERNHFDFPQIAGEVIRAWSNPSVELAREALRAWHKLGKATIEATALSNDNIVPEVWYEAFYREFGEDAVLSLASLVDRDFGPAKNKKIADAVRNERHIKADNLIYLPPEVTTFLYTGVANSMDYYDELIKHPIEVAPELKQAVFTHLRRYNEQFIEVLHQILNDPEKGKVLTKLVSLEKIKFFEEKLANFSLDSFDLVENAVFLGQYDPHTGKFLYSPGLLDDLSELKRTHIHELSHMFSSAADYTSDFVTFMLLIADQVALRELPEEVEIIPLIKSIDFQNIIKSHSDATFVATIKNISDTLRRFFISED